ncbi:MAG: histidinol-phosphate transaminase [Thermodesulfovibrionales bacterium]|nr:histidinol-phosphate transaminase [Thermodesulfovibrionales bacterium]
MKKFDAKSLARPNIRSLRAYEAKEMPCRVKLDANESPFGFKVRQSVIKRISTNRYPDPEARALRGALAKQLEVKPPNILVGNGSDEIIYYLITTFGGPVLFPVPTFSMYGIIGKALGESIIGLPLDGSFDLDLPLMLGALKTARPKLTFLSSPNNPTGNCFSSDRMLKVIESSSALVVVDEAYQPFSSDKGFLPMLKDYKNLLILRTLSKVGLAGLRTGYLIGDEAIINEVNKVRLPFNLNSYSQAIAVSAIEDRKAMRSAIKAVVSERERLFEALEGIKAATPYPSEANFILFKVKNSRRVYNKLLKQGVLLRDMSGAVDGCLRVTVGTKAENNFFLKALKEVAR